MRRLIIFFQKSPPLKNKKLQEEKMKVALIMPWWSHHVPSTSGGAIVSLMSMLINENEKSDKCTIYCVQKDVNKEQKKEIVANKYKQTELVFVKYNKLINAFQRGLCRLLSFLHIKNDLPYLFPLNYQKKVFKQVKKINPDVIIFQNYLDADIKQYIKEFGKEKLYYHVHTMDEPKYHIEKYLAGIIGVSRFIKTDYEEFAGLDENLNDYVLPNCVNEKYFSRHITEEQRDALRTLFGFSKEDLVVIYCGRMLESKGVDKLIESILQTPQNIKLLIVGSSHFKTKKKSPFMYNIQKIADENPSKIKLTGYIDQDKLYQYYGIADLQVVPTIIEEAAGLVVIEGQLCGVPQIVTRSGGMPEYITKDTVVIERDGELVGNLRDEIMRLSKDKKLLNKMSQSSLEHSKAYTSQGYYNNFVEIVENILDKNSQKK